MSLELHKCQARNQALTRTIKELEAQLQARDTISEERLLAELPGRTARALQAANDVAEEIVTRARHQATTISETAQLNAAELVARAEEEAASLVQRARAEAKQLVTTASATRERILEQAREERSTILADLELRRAELADDILGIESGLLELREAHDGAKRSVDAVLRRLNREDTTVPRAVGPASFDPPSQRALPVRGRERSRMEPAASGRRAATNRGLGLLIVGERDQFRSVWAASLFSRALDADGIGDATVRVSQDPSDGPIPESILAALERTGIDLRRYDSVPLTRETVSAADLILGMTARDVQHVVGSASSVAAKTFTMRELARVGQSVGPRRTEESFRQWLERVHAARDVSPFHGKGDDVESPRTTGRRSYQAVSLELTQLVESVGGLIWPGRWRTSDAQGEAAVRGRVSAAPSSSRNGASATLRRVTAKT